MPINSIMFSQSAVAYRIKQQSSKKYFKPSNLIYYILHIINITSTTRHKTNNETFWSDKHGENFRLFYVL